MAKVGFIVLAAIAIAVVGTLVIEWVERAPSEEQRMLRAAKEAARDDRRERTF